MVYRILVAELLRIRKSQVLFEPITRIKNKNKFLYFLLVLPMRLHRRHLPENGELQRHPQKHDTSLTDLLQIRIAHIAGILQKKH